MNRAQGKYLLRRLQSLTGILPLTVFLANHYYTNAHALVSADAFNQAAASLHQMPYLWAAEIFVVFLPLLFHSIYGLFITVESHPNNDSYPFYQNFAYVAQRVTGVVLILFVVFHVWGTRVQQLLYDWGAGGALVDYAYMADYFTPGWVQAIYIIGLASVAFHVGNGLFNFAFKWGIVVSEKAQRVMTKLSIGISLVLFAIGLNILYAFN